MDNPENKSTIELLTDFANWTSRKIYASEILYPSLAIRRVTLHKRTVYIPDTKEELCFLVGYHDPKSFSENELFFGVFFTIPFPSTTTFNIRKKDMLDKLNPFLAKKSLTIGSPKFDSSTVITGNNKILTSEILNDTKVQDLILELLEIRDCVNIGLNDVDLDFVPHFKDKSSFGVFTKQVWFVDTEMIENLFAKVRQLRQLIIEK